MTCKTKYYRDFARFNSDLFLRDLESTDVIVDNDVNMSMNRLVALLGIVNDKLAPIREVTGKKKKLLSKPWITTSILTPIKRRQTLFRTHYLTDDIAKVKYYKSYDNKLNKILKAAKHNYFKAQFELNKLLKTTWKLIGVLTNKTKNTQSMTLNKLIYKNKLLYILINKVPVIYLRAY